MKHNLPTPSQAWGSDIDRRVAYLENDMTLMKSKVSNSYDAVSALTSSRAANGVAQPFYQEMLVEQPGSNPGIGAYEDLWKAPLDWGNAGSFMQLSITGFLYIPVIPLTTGEYIFPQVFTGVRDHLGRERKLAHIPYVVSGLATGRGGRGTDLVMVTGLSFTMVVDYDNFQYGTAFIGLKGSKDHPEYIDNHNGHAYVSVQFSGVRY